MNLIEERRLSQIRQKIRRLRQKQKPAQLILQDTSDTGPVKINLDRGFVGFVEAYGSGPAKHYYSPQDILTEEIGWEAYEWQRT